MARTWRSIEPRIRGAWQPTPTGYRLELRVPLSMLGGGFGVLIDDRDQRGAAPGRATACCARPTCIPRDS